MQEINLYDLLKHYAKYWYFIVAMTLLALIAGLIYNNFIQVPLYKSNATLIVVNTSGTTLKSDATLINNYQQLLKSRRVIEQVISERSIKDSYQTVVDSVDTTNEKDTEVIKVSYYSTSPEQSQIVLSATIESFKNKIKDIYGNDNIQVVDGASIAYEPYNVSKLLQLALAAAVGLLSSIIILFFVYDYRLSTKDKPNSDKKRKPSILARYHAKTSAIRQARKAKKQVRKAKRELKSQAKAQGRKLAEVQKAIERKAEARRQASAKAVATKKAKAEMIAQSHKDEAERAIKIEQLKAKQIADAKKLALAEAEAKKDEIIKQGIILKKAQDRQERREIRIAKIKSTIESTKKSMAEARKSREQQRIAAQLEQVKRAKAEARKKSAAKARAAKKAKAQQAKKAELDKQAEIARVAAIGKAKRAEQAAKYSTNSVPAFSQSTKAEKK